MIFNIGDKVHRNVLLSCDHGLMIVNRFDCNHENVGHGQWLLDHGNASTIEAANCFAAIKDLNEPIIFDIGANIGTFTTWIAKAFPNGKVYAFEPQRAVFQILSGNAAINNLYNVYTYNIGLGKVNTKIEFEEPNYFSNNDFGMFSLVEKMVTESKDKIVVQINTLDWFLEYYNVPKVHLLKIDVEGMDLDVLIGGTNTIKKHLPVIFIEHCDNRKTILEDIKNFLDQFDYGYTVIGNNVMCKPL